MQIEGTFICNNLCSYFICLLCVVLLHSRAYIFKRGYWTFNEYSKETSYFGGRFTEINSTKFAFKSVCEKEFKTLFRTPQFFLNCIVQTFVMPIMLFFILFVQDGNLKFITEYINNPETTGFAIGVGLCASLFLMGSNVIATTSFSRDGSSWFVNRYLPVKASDIFCESNHCLVN